MLTPQTIKKFNIGLNISNHERDLVSFSFLVRNGTSREKRDVENSREKWTRLEKIYYYIVPSIAWYILVRHTNKPNLNSVCLFIHLSACLSVRPSVCLSVCIPALLSALRLTLWASKMCALRLEEIEELFHFSSRLVLGLTRSTNFSSRSRLGSKNLVSLMVKINAQKSNVN